MRKGSFGYRLTLRTGLDLSSATALKVRIRRPAGVSPLVIEAALTTPDILDRASGTIGYPVADGDFPVVGMYLLQVFDVTPGRSVASDIASFYVSDNLPSPS